MRRTVTAIALAALAGCGSDTSTSSIAIEVEYPSAGAEVSTNSLHFWVLAARGLTDAGTLPGCSELVGGELGPYDFEVERLADFVVITADAPGGLAEEVPRRSVLVYVEAVDFVGRTHLAGCAPLSMAADAESVTLTLRNPGTYDCGDAAVEDGAPCDDGVYCTVGETCDGGQCGDGGPRNCTFVADQCNSEACSEELGCHAAPLPDNRACEDGLFCTAGDACQDGICESGGDRDCSTSDGTCRRGVCNENSDQCVPVVDNTLACSDNLFCTVVDSCSGVSGICSGPTTNCAIATNTCNLGSCSEGAQGACIQTPRNQGFTCSTNCTSLGTCNTGLCTGGTPLTPGTTEGPMGSANCADFIDNDCDGLFDASDPNCQ